MNSDECLAKVNHQVAEARAKGVTGVPFTIIDGKWAVSGGQSAPVYVKVRMIRKTAVDSVRLTTHHRYSASWRKRQARHRLSRVHLCPLRLCSSVTLCPDCPASLLFILHFMVYWSRRYPQFPVPRDRHPIPHRLSPCHYQSFLCFTFFFL